MNLLRPRYLALAFAAYFGAVCYYAAQEGRRAIFGAYSNGISQAVFQTTMVGGVLVLLGLFVTASISPHVKGAAPSRSPRNLGAARDGAEPLTCGEIEAVTQRPRRTKTPPTI